MSGIWAGKFLIEARKKKCSACFNDRMQKLRKDYKDVADTLARTQQNITSALKSYRSAVDSLEQRICKDKRV
jgi:DNA anti-recombination protein RmuC